jgi:hypothetical protein
VRHLREARFKVACGDEPGAQSHPTSLCLCVRIFLFPLRAFAPLREINWRRPVERAPCHERGTRLATALICAPHNFFAVIL